MGFTLPNQVAPYYILFWKDCTYPPLIQGRYMIRSDGVIYDKVLKRCIPQHADQRGYVRTSLYCSDGSNKDISVHRLVAYEFCNPPENYTEYQVNHIIPNPSLNAYINLEWVTPNDNMQHAKAMNLMRKDVYSNRKLTDTEVREICKLLEIGMYSDEEIVKMLNLNIHKSAISSIRNGYTWPNISKEYNIVDKERRRYKLDDNTVHEICKRLVKRNKTFKEIAEEVGIQDFNYRYIINRIRDKQDYFDIVNQYEFSDDI